MFEVCNCCGMVPKTNARGYGVGGCGNTIAMISLWFFYTLVGAFPRRDPDVRARLGAKKKSERTASPPSPPPAADRCARGHENAMNNHLWRNDFHALIEGKNARRPGPLVVVVVVVAGRRSTCRVVRPATTANGTKNYTNTNKTTVWPRRSSSLPVPSPTTVRSTRRLAVLVVSSSLPRYDFIVITILLLLSRTMNRRSRQWSLSFFAWKNAMLFFIRFKHDV